MEENTSVGARWWRHFDCFVHQFSGWRVCLLSLPPDGALTMLGMEPINSFHISSEPRFILRSIISDALCFFFQQSCQVPGFQFFALQIPKRAWWRRELDLALCVRSSQTQMKEGTSPWARPQPLHLFPSHHLRENTSLVAHWLGLQASTAGVMGVIPGQGIN